MMWFKKIKSSFLKRICFLNEASKAFRYERIVTGSRGYGFYEWDTKKNHVFWEGQFWLSFGYDQKDIDILSNNPIKFYDYIHPEDRADLREEFVKYLKSKRNGGEVVCRLRNKKGDYSWIEIRSQIEREENGRVKYISGVIFDVTRLKKTEEALLIVQARHERILNATNDGIWEWDVKTDDLTLSPRCWEQLGYTSDDHDIRSKVTTLAAWRDMIHEDDIAQFDKQLFRHLHEQKLFDIEYRIRGKFNQWCWIRVRGQVQNCINGFAGCMSGTNMDIAQLKQVQKRFVKAKETAEDASRAKSDFLSSMSHELRTPLNAILGFTQVFDLDTHLDEQQKENILEIKKAGTHLLGLINDVLDLSQLESGNMSLPIDHVEPEELLKECIALLQIQAEARGIQIESHSKLPKTHYVLANKLRFKQIILNLLGNAVKYNVEGGSISIQVHQIGCCECEISISDTGIGISEEHQQSIFQPFNRLGVSHQYAEGTGIGLTIAKRFVEQMSGTMGFKSTEEAGSTFWFQLPSIERYEDPEIIEPQFSLASSPYQKRTNLLFSDVRKVLYVEDNESNQRLMERILKPYGQISLKVVGEGFSGLYEARTNPPDLIILDINLPGMTGYEALDILTRDKATSQIPVIALSANAVESDIRFGLKAGFKRYLTKPLQINELIDTFNTYL